MWWPMALLRGCRRQVRASLWALAGRLLKPGGLHYTSYNTEPGWLAAKPFQHLVMLRQAQGRTGAQALRSGMDTWPRSKPPSRSSMPPSPR
jgi:hypothetical protein